MNTTQAPRYGFLDEEPLPYFREIRKGTKLWTVKFFGKDGQFRDSLEHYSKVKPTTWAGNRIAD